MKKSLWLTFVLALAAAPAARAQEEHAASPLTVEFGLMFWTLVVFVLLLVILKKFAWPAILGAVEAREAALEQQIADAERSRAEAAKLLEEHKRLVAEAKAQAHGIVLDARQLSERERAVALEKAKQEQEELLARARREIAAERDRALPTCAARPWICRWRQRRSWSASAWVTMPTGRSSWTTSLPWTAAGEV